MIDDEGFKIVLQSFLQFKNCLKRGSSFDIIPEDDDFSLLSLLSILSCLSCSKVNSSVSFMIISLIFSSLLNNIFVSIICVTFFDVTY